MGSSAKKKREKKKDFAKPKLKVGKTKAKAANFTSTSFKSKGIVLGQKLQTGALTDSVKIQHNLSLLSHHSANTRREALSSITSTTSIPNASIIPALAPVILDSAPAVRTQLLTLLNTLDDVSAIRMYTDRFLLYIHSAMTHISEDIRTDSTNFLGWLLKAVGHDGIRGRGWGKTLNCWMVLMGWEGQKTNLFSANKKAVVQHLTVLGQFLSLGFDSVEDKDYVHLLPKSSNIFAHLSLFAQDEGADDEDSRKRIFKAYEENVRKGLDAKRKEGGEFGRAATAVIKIIDKSGVNQY